MQFIRTLEKSGLGRKYVKYVAVTEDGRTTSHEIYANKEGVSFQLGGFEISTHEELERFAGVVGLAWKDRQALAAEREIDEQRSYLE